MYHEVAVLMNTGSSLTPNPSDDRRKLLYQHLRQRDIRHSIADCCFLNAARRMLHNAVANSDYFRHAPGFIAMPISALGAFENGDAR
jgi:hypothetical protein